MKTKEGIEVAVGQIWRDLDKRMGTHSKDGRQRKIVALHENRGKVTMDEIDADFINTKHPTMVAVSRMHRHSTGWVLVK